MSYYKQTECNYTPEEEAVDVLEVFCVPLNEFLMRCEKGVQLLLPICTFLSTHFLYMFSFIIIIRRVNFPRKFDMSLKLV